MQSRKDPGYLKVAALGLFVLALSSQSSCLADQTHLEAEDRSKAMPAKDEKAKLNVLAPDFELSTPSGKKVRLSDFRGKQPVVVYFYPKDETRGCTAEACAFRDSYEDFKKEGAEVIGISSDSADSHKNFAANHNLPFILLSDDGGKVRAAWGVPPTIGILPGRVTYVIDKKGVIRLIFESQTQPVRHVEEAKTMLNKLKAE